MIAFFQKDILNINLKKLSKNYILMVYILLINKIIYKWPFYIWKPKFTNSVDFFKKKKKSEVNQEAT